MDIKNLSDEAIDYLYDDLPDEEKAAFEEKLKSDPQLAEEIARAKTMMMDLKALIQLDRIKKDPGYEWACEEADKLVKEHNKKKRIANLRSKVFRPKVIFSLAAVILVLLFVGSLTRIVVRPDIAFQKYYRDFTTVYYSEATLNEAEDLFTLSKEEYNNDDFSAVAENMRALMEKGQLNIRGSFLLGFYDAFIELTGTIFAPPTVPSDMDQEEATWYLALTSFKLKDFSTAQIFLNKISSENSRFGKRARQLSREITRMKR